MPYAFSVEDMVSFVEVAERSKIPFSVPTRVQRRMMAIAMVLIMLIYIPTLQVSRTMPFV